jgi:flagellar biosynthesis anti-sigma factor FlgM
MRIDNNRPNFDPALASERTSAAQHVNGASSGQAASGSSDQVSLSSDAQLVAAAVDAANSTSDVRPDVVARAKALLAEGKVGDDPHRLADKLIDSCLP